MDNLEMAQNALQIAETVSPEHRDWWQCQAKAYAAIAQAEQLKRLADNLDLIVQEWGKPHYTVNPILK